MPKSDLKLQSGDYAPVADRIALFYQAFPAGRIVTDLLSYEGGRMIVRASVFRHARDTEPAATGLAAEWEGDGEINAVACLENTETSAVGRALANLGFTASRRRPSVEEMAKADRARRRIGLSAVSAVSAVRAVAEARAVERCQGAPTPDRQRAEDTVLQAHADAIADVVRLLEIAHRLGFDPTRAERIRQRLVRGAVPPSGAAKLERLLRGWLRSREGRRFEYPREPGS